MRLSLACVQAFRIECYVVAFLQPILAKHAASQVVAFHGHVNNYVKIKVCIIYIYNSKLKYRGKLAYKGYIDENNVEYGLSIVWSMSTLPVGTRAFLDQKQMAKQL